MFLVSALHAELAQEPTVGGSRCEYMPRSAYLVGLLIFYILS